MKTNLTKLYAGAESPGIIGRDSELEALMITLLRFEKPNVVLVAEPGVGKTALVHMLAYLIANNLCPKELMGFQVVEINTNALLAGPGYRGVTEDKFEGIIRESLSNGKTILFFDEFHTVEKLGQMANGQTPGLGNTLKPYLTRADFRVIGATTVEEFNTITDKALMRRFRKLIVKEPTDEAVLSIIEQCYINYGAGRTIKKSVFKQTLELSKSLDGFNPDKSKDICDLACSYSKLKDIKQIDEKLVETVYQLFFADGKYVPQEKLKQQERGVLQD